MDEAYDGTVDRRLQIEVGTPDQHEKVLPSVEVRHKRSNFCYSTGATGWAMSIFGIEREGTSRFSDYLKVMRAVTASHRITETATLAPFANAPCLELKIASGSESHTYYFDLVRSYALRGSETRINSKILESSTIEELIEASPGVFYPGKVTSHSDIPQRYRFTYAASSVSANDPKFDPKIFTLLPAGVTVYDMDAPGRPKRIEN